jgi:hypothetical protein
MKDSSNRPPKSNAAADFWRQAGVDQAAFGVSEHEQGFHSQAKLNVDSRVALPASLPPLRGQTVPPAGPEDDPTDAPEAYATGEFSFPDTEDDEMAFLTPPSPPSGRAQARYPASAPDSVLVPLHDLFSQPLGHRPAAAPVAPVEPEPEPQAVGASDRIVGAVPQGPALARRIWRGRIKPKSD